MVVFLIPAGKNVFLFFLLKYMKKTSFFVLPKYLVAFLTLSFTFLQVFFAAGFGQSSLAHANPNSQLTISQLQVSPDPYDPSHQSQVTLSFQAENTQGEHFNAVVLDTTHEMLAGWGGVELEEGLNVLLWTPSPQLENGTYTFVVTTATNSPMETQYTHDFQVSRPGFQALVISDLIANPSPYQLSSNIPLTLSFNVQNAQNRYYSAAIVDPLGGILEEWESQPLGEGVNTLRWWGYQNSQFKAGTYKFIVHAPLASNSQSYSLDFQIIE